MNILETITEKTRLRVADLKRKNRIDFFKSKLNLYKRENFIFEKILRKDEGISFICEVKKASPSKGLIAKEFPYADIAKEYEQAKADAMSILTEPYFFRGKTEYFEQIRKITNIPLLRKDFIIDEVQIYETKSIGADGMLLICSILEDSELKEYIQIADSIGLSCLVEAHDEREIEKALKANARIIGVNNRNLKDFTVDIKNSISLREQVPKEIIFVSESGIKTNDDINELKKNNVNAVLIGETLMLSKDKEQTLRELRGF
jgi:indole-3-glycerol phosphate synthase